jgi:hypothetical protein
LVTAEVLRFVKKAFQGLLERLKSEAVGSSLQCFGRGSFCIGRRLGWPGGEFLIKDRVTDRLAHYICGLFSSWSREKPK